MRLVVYMKFYVKFSAQLLSQAARKISHGDNLNEHDNCEMRKLIIHGFKKLHGAILTKMEILQRDKKIYHLVDLLGWKH